MSSVTCAFFSWWLRRLTATSSAARLVLPSDDPAPVIDSNAPTRTSVLLDLRRRRQRTECKHGRERDDRAIGQRTAEDAKNAAFYTTAPLRHTLVVAGEWLSFGERVPPAHGLQDPHGGHVRGAGPRDGADRRLGHPTHQR